MNNRQKCIATCSKNEYKIKSLHMQLHPQLYWTVCYGTTSIYNPEFKKRWKRSTLDDQHALLLVLSLLQTLRELFVQLVSQEKADLVEQSSKSVCQAATTTTSNNKTLEYTITYRSSNKQHISPRISTQTCICCVYILLLQSFIQR